MAQRSFPFDAGAGATISETDWQKMARRFRQTGVIGGYLSQLAASADGSALSVSVATGGAFVEGFYYENDAPLAVPLAAANATNPRIDTIIVRLDRTANTAVLDKVTGTPAASPVAATLSQTDSLYELPLANVLVPAAAGVIVAGNVTDRRSITQTFDSAAYASKAALDRVLLPASTFSTISGAAAMGQVNVLAALLFDAAGVEEAGSVATVPAIWATFDILLWWTNAGAGTGNVVWRLDHAVTIDGGTLTRVINTATTLTAPAQGVVTVSTLVTNVTRTDFPVVHVNAVRLGSNAGDTLPNDAALIAVELRKKTYA